MSDWPKSPGNVEAALERSGRFIREQAAELDRLRAENARLQSLCDDYEAVLVGMGYPSRRCRACHRKTYVRGYLCWSCGHDNSVADVLESAALEGGEK